jgi:hypothetical protein
MAGVSISFTYNYSPSAGEWSGYFAQCQPWSAFLDQVVAQGGAPSFVAPAPWIPVDASGATLVFTSVSAEYTVVGNLAIASATLTYPTTVDTSAAIIGGLPYPVPNVGYAKAPEIAYIAGAAAVLLLPVLNSSTFAIYALASGAAIQNVTLSGKTISLQIAWPLS